MFLSLWLVLIESSTGYSSVLDECVRRVELPDPRILGSLSRIAPWWLPFRRAAVSRVVASA